MEELIGDLIVRCIPVALPAFFVVALLVHWGILPDGTEKKNRSNSEEKPKKEKKAEGDEKGGE